MPPEVTQDQLSAQPPAEVDDPAIGSVDLTPDHVRSTPEYRELVRQNRILARQKGDADRQIAEARTRAEAATQAAEADRMAAQETKVREILGDDGVALWEQFADLSTTDPVRAAELLASYKGKAQSQPPATPESQPAGERNTQVSQSNVPPATGLSRTVGDAPLAGPADDTDSVVEALEKRYADMVERNQDPSRRNRVTMKDRANAMIAYVGAAYLKSGAKPKS